MARTFDLGCSFGMMQGRLSTQTERGYQAFPWGTWQDEFVSAAARGLEHIEWVLDSWRLDENPILNETSSVVERTQETGVKVVSVCADYLMDRPLNVSGAGSWLVLSRLAYAMQELGAQWLVVPCVDQSSLRTPSSLERFVRAAHQLNAELAGTGIRVSLETDLGPAEFAALLSHLDPTVFGVNYDIGNSAYLGYSHEQEFNAYGDRISLIHIKDRLFEGGSVPLGHGTAEIPGVIELLRKMEFNGPVTMQAFRDVQGLDVLDDQLLWLQTCLEGGA
jgi:sugar phosphate isomerase/epimerase